MSTLLARPIVERAYRKWKQSVYYERSDLFQRQRLAAFETTQRINSKFDEIVDVLESETPETDPRFRQWLDEIKFRVMPKKVDRRENGSSSEDGVFLSNITSDHSYPTSRVNYLFDAPVPLHILGVLWLMTEGWALDRSLSEDAYGSRLDATLYSKGDTGSLLFRHYPTQYGRWRDEAIRHAERLLKDEKQGVCLLALDIQQFYYRVRIDFEAIATELDSLNLDLRFQVSEFEPHGDLRHSLRAMIQRTIETYREAIQPHLKQSHGIEDQSVGIPLSYVVSPVLANWALRSFDKRIRRELNPTFYGRYVDDMLLVVPDNMLTSREPRLPANPLRRFLRHTFVERKLLKAVGNRSYSIVGRSELLLQQEKCMLQHFDKEHSSAGLEKFKRNLEQASSEFRLLPDDDIERPLKDVAWQLLYEGSVNKLRNVKGFREDRNELAKYLAKRIALHLHTDVDMSDDLVEGLFHFFKGVNALEFHEMWERVLSLFTIAGQTKTIRKFRRQINDSIAKLQFEPGESHGNSRAASKITTLLRNNLNEHLELCLAMAQALCANANEGRSAEQDAHLFRASNMMRHYLVRHPLANYTMWEGNLVSDAPPRDLDLDPNRMRFSPRFVYLHELMAFYFDRFIQEDPGRQWARIQTDYVSLNGTKVENASIEEQQERE